MKPRTAEQYLEVIQEKNLPEDTLDDLVHDLKSSEASAINNDGADSQVRYIIESGATDELDELLGLED